MFSTLRELFDGTPCRILASYAPETVIRAIVTDSRRAVPGALFVALPGQKTNGLLFVRDAVARGASAVLAPEPPDAAVVSAVPWICTDNPRALLSDLAARLYGFPARELTLHAITGTNGKTTTAYMLAHILRRMGRRLAFWTTNSVEGMGSTPFRPHMTTPDAPELHQFLRQARNQGAEDVVIEVSSHALQLGRVRGLGFKSAAVTNITPDHLDFHGTFTEYVKAKASLLASIQPDGMVALNADDPIVSTFAPHPPVRAVRFGMSLGAEVRAELEELGISHSLWRWVFGNRLEPEIRLPVPGQHNVMNALCALTMAVHLGVDAIEAASSLEDFTPAPRRLETIQIGDFTVTSDVAMNRGSYDAVMKSVMALRRPLVVVNAIRGNRGIAVNADIADVLADWDDLLHFAPVIVTASESHVNRLSVDYRARSEEVSAFADSAHNRGLSLEYHNELSDALDSALKRLNTGGVLLLLGTFGMDDGLKMAETKLRQILSG